MDTAITMPSAAIPRDDVSAQTVPKSEEPEETRVVPGLEFADEEPAASAEPAGPEPDEAPAGKPDMGAGEDATGDADDELAEPAEPEPEPADDEAERADSESSASEDDESPETSDDDAAAEVAAPVLTAPVEEDAQTPATDGEVTVVPGVPRYHRAECILIRFMGEDDLDKMSLKSATESGCTPCRACQPELAESGTASS
jgi:hypothetical protein